MPEKELPKEPVKIPAKQAARLNQTTKNMIWAVLATLAVVVPVLALNVSPNLHYNPEVNAQQIAQDVQPSAGFPLAQPVMPPGWKNNYARYEVGSDQVSSWNVGYLTPNEQFIGLTQSANANETWVAQKITEAEPGAPVEINGISWKTYQSKKENAGGQKNEYMVGKKGNETFILEGTASQADFTQLATAVTS